MHGASLVGGRKGKPAKRARIASPEPFVEVGRMEAVGARHHRQQRGRLEIFDANGAGGFSTAAVARPEDNSIEPLQRRGRCRIVPETRCGTSAAAPINRRRKNLGGIRSCQVIVRTDACVRKMRSRRGVGEAGGSGGVGDLKQYEYVGEADDEASLRVEASDGVATVVAEGADEKEEVVGVDEVAGDLKHHALSLALPCRFV